MQDALWDFEADGGGAPRPQGRPPAGEPHRYRRRGLDRCPKCGHPVEVFPIAQAEGYDAVLPGEYPSTRVPEDAARHVVRGQLWPGRDPAGWSRIHHLAVCPDEAMPEDRELLQMWRTLRVRRRARLEG
ncbi:MAG TPA: DUF6083 domain-containing protein [Actinospica sp.]|nr:DUF6083 domain-containing protein [Actinospica sp.]